MILRLLVWSAAIVLCNSLGLWLIGRSESLEPYAGVLRFWWIVLSALIGLGGCAVLAGQLQYFLRRAVQIPFILAVIYLITFALVWVAPGDPFQQTDRVSKEAIAHMKQKFHAEHWYTFITYYPWKILTTGDFGPSMTNQAFSVNDILWQKLPVSVMLGLVALAIALVAGIAFGTIAAVNRDGPMDWFSVLLALAGISIPSFVFASMLVVIFAIWLPWLPIDGWRPGTIRDMILPSVALAMLPMAYITRLTRVAMIDVLGSDFVRTARAKGLSKSTVVWKHCLRNAMLPVLSYIGPAAATTLTGSFVIEIIFNVPGLGQFFVDSVKNRDQTLILGLVLVQSAILLSLNLAVDILYGIMDPRIEVSQ